MNSAILLRKALGHLRRLTEIVEDEHGAAGSGSRNRRGLLDQIAQMTGRLEELKKTIDALSRKGKISRRLQTMPGVGLSPPLPLRPLRRQWRPSSAVEISRPGSG